MTRILLRLFLALRGSVPVLLAFALVAAGCQPEQAPPETTDSTASRSGFSVAQALAQDPEMLELLGVATQIAGDIHRFGRSLSDEDLDGILSTLQHPEFEASSTAPELLVNLGSDPALLAEMRIHLESLIERHGLQTATPQQVQQAFSMALSSQGLVEALDAFIEEQLANEDDPEVQACEEECELEYDIMVGAAIVWYVGMLALSVSQGLAGVVTAVGATFATAEWILMAESIRDRCIEECNGIEDDDCDWDPDCGDNEYCWTGVLGVGKNECRPEKAEGKTCSRDGQCLSGCCKYHAWSNPLSQVCRPASKCN